MTLSVYDEGTVLRYLYFGVEKGVYPPLIFLGIGAMTDFSTMLSNPKLVLLGAAAQVGVFLTYLGALDAVVHAAGSRRHRHHRRCRRPHGDLPLVEAGSRTARRHCHRRLFVHGPRARDSTAHHAAADHPRRAADSHETFAYMSRDKSGSYFPIAAFLICTMLAPGAIVLIGMLFFGNLLKECTVTERLALRPARR